MPLCEPFFSGFQVCQECNVGGVEGAAMEPWLQIGGTNLVTKAGLLDVVCDDMNAVW